MQKKSTKKQQKISQGKESWWYQEMYQKAVVKISPEKWKHLKKLWWKTLRDSPEKNKSF